MTDFLPFAGGKQRIKKRNPWKNIMVVLDVDSKMPTVAGKWKRLQGGRIKATYTLEEYLLCLRVFEARKEYDDENNR